jgi:hypothetical protein
MVAQMQVDILNFSTMTALQQQAAEWRLVG